MPKPDLLRSEQSPIDSTDEFLALRVLKKYAPPEPEAEPGVEKCATCERPAWTCRKCGGVRCGHKCSDKDRESMTATCLDCVTKGDVEGHPFRGNQWTDGNAALAMGPEDEGGAAEAERTPQTKTPAFRRWFKGSKVTDEDGTPRRVFHGTTHNFDQFGPQYGNPENSYGRAYYFTDSPDDASYNYAGQGADLTSRIEAEAERIASERDVNMFDGADETKEYEAIKEEVRAKLKGESDAVVPAFLSMKNPVVAFSDVRAHGSPYKPTRFEIEIDDDGNESGSGVDLYNAVNHVALQYGLDPGKAWAPVSEKLAEGGASAFEVEMALRKNEDLYDLTDDQGRSTGAEFIRDVWKEMGFDGVIINARERFPGMDELDDNTHHYIVFEPTQVKSATGNKGTFNPLDPRITRAEPPGPAAEHAIRFGEPILKYDPDQPREPEGTPGGGRFAKDPGTGGAAKPEGTAAAATEGAETKTKATFDLNAWKAKFSKDAKGTIGEWTAMKPSERMKLADPLRTVPARMKEHLGDEPWPERSGSVRTDIENRLNQFAQDIHPDSHQQASRMLMSMNDALTRIGVPIKDADRMMRNATDHLLAQEFEAQTRLLGDHGAAHLAGDWRLSMKILDEIPGGPASPREAALMAVVAVYHDAGYLTPPMRASLPGHQNESAYYFKKSIAPLYENVLGKEWTKEAERIIAHHDTDRINFADRRLTAFSLADNLALFHREKLPPAIRQVKGNADMLVRLANGQITQEQAEAQFVRNIDRSTLSPKAKARMKQGTYDLTKRTRESVLSMFGAQIKGVKWQKDHLDIHLTRNASNAAIGKVIDCGQNGFKKLCEAYKVDANNPDLVQNGFTFTEKSGRSKVRFRFTDAWATKADDLWDGDVILKGDVPGHEFHGNQWTDGTGSLPEIQRGRMIEHEDESYVDSKGVRSPPAGKSKIGEVTWYWRFREEFSNAPPSATITASDVDMEYERHAAKAAIEASDEFWADNSADARAVRAHDEAGEDPLPAAKRAVSITTIFTMNPADYGAGSGGTGSAKVFWGPYSAENRQRRLTSPNGYDASRSMGVDPIYVLAHEYHHALGYGSELDLSSEVAAVAGHFRAGVPSPAAVQDTLFSLRANMDRKAVYGQALHYLRAKYPKAFEREAKKQFSYEPDDDQSYKDAQEKAWREFNAKLDAIGRRKRSE